MTKYFKVDKLRYRKFQKLTYCNKKEFYMEAKKNSKHANFDQTIDEKIRTHQGAFFTPKFWVDASHVETCKILGDDWYKTHVVWDCCAGSGNLFRDYKFDNLIVSTLAKDEVDLLHEQGFSQAFQYDFLNPTDHLLVEGDSPNKIPKSVEDSLLAFAKEGKPLVFFINPPYAASGTLKEDAENKTGVSNTLVKENMKHLGACRSNLYFQFIFECVRQAERLGFKNVSLCFFSPIKFMIQETAKKFRAWMYDKYQFKYGFFFNASAFSGVSSEWGVSFTIWQNGKNTADPILDVRELDGTHISKKHIYNCDNQKSASEWVREPIKHMETYEYPIMTSGLKIKEREKTGPIKKAPPKDIPYVDHPIIPFTQKWLTSENKYQHTSPNPKEGYEQWVDDGHIYSIFETKNNCTSMRDVSWGGEIWQIKNHFFWLERFGIKGLLKDKCPIIYNDFEKYFEESYVATLIHDLTLSKEAIAVLEYATNLWVKSLDTREAYATANPELQLTCWDCGWYQLKGFWEKEYNTDFKKLKELHKALGDKLRPGVYEYGFLKE